MTALEVAARCPEPPLPDAGARSADVNLDPARWRMLPVILIGSFLSFLDFFIVTVALPAIRTDLHASPAALQFVVAAYGVGFGVSLITGGRLGDIYGRKRMFMVAIAGFALASGLCGIAQSPAMLIAARVLQAIMAAGLTPQVLSIIRSEFAPQERAVAIGYYSTSMGLASIMGQILGGLLVSLDLFGWSWRLIFLINLPIGALAFWLAARLVRESRSPTRPTLDIGGVIFASVGLVLLIYPAVAGREAGWPLWSWVMPFCAIPVAACFIWHEKRVIRSGATPLIALHLFVIPSVRMGLLSSITFFFGLGVTFVVLAVTFQSGFGISAFGSGLLFLCFAVGFSVTSALSGAIAARIGWRIIILGLALMILGLIMLVSIGWANPATLPIAMIAVSLLTYGLGQGLAQPAMVNLVIGNAAVQAEDTGSAVGLFLTTAQSCIALGVAIIGDIYFTRLGATPTTGDYWAATSAALACTLLLLTLSGGLVILSRRTL